jgi:hypothetical protein
MVPPRVQLACSTGYVPGYGQPNNLGNTTADQPHRMGPRCPNPNDAKAAAVKPDTPRS